MAETACQQELADLEDDRPLAVRRKRRMSSSSVAIAAESGVQKREDDVEQPMLSAKTPTKSKKRVRFSDPGLVMSTSSSTGLTPHMKRTSFIPTTCGLLSSGPKRLSLPVQLSAPLSSPSLSPSPAPASGEVQFEPFRQILEPRVKRRLKRNGFSEEINSIEEAHKSQTRLKQELQDLRNQLTFEKDNKTKEHSENGNEEANYEKIQELQKELDEIRRHTIGRLTTMDPLDSTLPGQDHHSADIEIFVDNSDDLNTPECRDGEGLRDASTVRKPTSASEAATQASLPALAHTEALREARLSLEYMFPGEITLGLVHDDPRPLLDLMLGRMRDLKAQVLLAEDSLSTSQTQESNLRYQFNAVLAQLDRARKHAETMSQSTSKERTKADTSQARVLVLENTVQAAASKVQELEKDSGEKERSISKLQVALETYRVEVGKLESLVSKMEGEHNAALSGLRTEMDEAVADLECHVVAETRGRREAEHEVEARDERIKQLIHQEQELKHALNEKQQIIRETESIFEEERIGREREVGGLNVHIGQLSTKLSHSNAKAAKAEDKQHLLIRKLQEERDAGVKAVEAVHAELERAKQNADEVGTAYVNDVQRRGAEVTQNQGLLTPVSATRFKDVEGYVEVGRGKGRSKKRPDSGIVILEEDDFDEDTVMAEDL